VDIKNNNKNIQLLKEEVWTRRTIAVVTLLRRNKTIDSSDILEEIRRNNIREHEVDQVLKKENSLAWKQDGIIYIEGQIYIPNNRKIKEQILQENHNPADVGHLEQSRMLELIKQNYWCLGIKEDVKKYIQECFKYQ